jgi:biotin carboxylase
MSGMPEGRDFRCQARVPVIEQSFFRHSRESGSPAALQKVKEAGFPLSRE